MKNTISMKTIEEQTIRNSSMMRSTIKERGMVGKGQSMPRKEKEILRITKWKARGPRSVTSKVDDIKMENARVMFSSFICYISEAIFINHRYHQSFFENKSFIFSQGANVTHLLSYFNYN